MQVVIELTDEQWKCVQDGTWCGTKEILNGKPLPKGHGRLIDADELKKHKYHDSDRFENAVSIAHIDWADTIIEADGGE